MPFHGPRPLTEAQQRGQACIGCSTSAPPLHPGETFSIRHDDGVSRDVASVLCTDCLVAPRYQAAELPKDERGRVFFGVQDRRRGWAWVMDDDELVRFQDPTGVQEWAEREKYVRGSSAFTT
jgi:hypothetical protein